MNIKDAIAAMDQDWRLTKIEKTEDKTKVELTYCKGSEPYLVFVTEDWNLKLAIEKAIRLISVQYDPIPQSDAIPQD